ncbi:fumarylacetoacetate hydrolase family protein [Streptomyces sp. NBC_00322]|uniref:2-keto-4-pentenoate hydratase n=1 Tax=Streptomyces sp. NBC_00322 TaxID=2975712 RepID=UPI002E2AE2DD|nr:fumarylacetoacetate hydrolase family protein [Streptomyces sp. NBC_00322]
MSSTIAAAAKRLRVASEQHMPCAPVRDLIGTDDLNAAYDVQSENVARATRAGHVLLGRKIGITSPAVQRQLGVDQPDFGTLLQDMLITEDELPSHRLLQPRIEAEIAFVLGRDLDAPDIDEESVRKAVACMYAGLEIVDSRIRGWDITITDTIADNASCGLFVLGSRTTRLKDVEPAGVAMTMTVNGAIVSRGTGADCLGDPLYALLWLARKAAELGQPLRAGEIVLTGALGPMAPIHAGDVIEAGISGLGTVSTRMPLKEAS